MELELGLALPIQNIDLNICSFEESEDGSAYYNKLEKKRNFAESFDDESYYSLRRTHSSMLVWDGRRRSPDDGNDGNKPNFDDEKEEEEEGENMNGIVGWPPIKSWRKKLIHQNPHCGRRRMIINNGRSTNNNNNNNNNSIYVKVKMEGVAIGRKIDLMLFNSYNSLITTLLNMFSRYRGNDEDKEGGCCNYILSYLDKEGDWLLAGDVPWQIFIGTVQRIEITKQSSR